jgi:selenocysteine-specific elongation factor
MRRRVHEGGMRPPARGDLQETLGASDAEMRLAEELLVDEGVLVPVGVNLLARGTLEACRQKVLELAAANGKLTLNEFRRATGAGRNLCVAVLEHFDDEGLTRRIGNERELLAGPASEGEAP